MASNSAAADDGNSSITTTPPDENQSINPLLDEDLDVVIEAAERFRMEMGLRDTIPEDLFRKAVVLARRPELSQRFDNSLSEAERARVQISPQESEILRSLDDIAYPEDRRALLDESTHRWRQSTSLYATIALLSIGAAVQGWDQTGINGANLYLPEALGIPSHRGVDGRDRNYWILGIVNAAPYLSASIFGCWTADPINFHLGRRGTTFIAAIFCFLPVIGAAFVSTWLQLLLCRLLLGIGMGMKATTVPIYAAEISPAIIRGALVMSWQTWVSFGILLGFSANLAVYKAGDLTWRLQLGSAMIPAIPLLLGIYFCPESPRWYLKNGNYIRAYGSLRRLRRTNLQAARDVYYTHVQLFGFPGIQTSKDGSLRANPVKTYFRRLKELFTVPRIRRATLAAYTVMIAQQMCGINAMAFYSSTIFSEAGASNKVALLGSLGFGLVNFVFAFPAVLTIDSFGRRSLLLFTFPQMAWTLLAAGFSFYIPEDSKAHLGFIAFFVYLFTAFYSPGEGPVPFTYSAEVFPLSHRELGMGFSVATNLFWAAIVSVTFPPLKATFGPTGALGFYAGLNVIAFMMIFLFVPETKRQTLEDLDKEFKNSIRDYANYQLTVTLPSFFNQKLRRFLFPCGTRPEHGGTNVTFNDWKVLQDRRRLSAASTV